MRSLLISHRRAVRHAAMVGLTACLGACASMHVPLMPSFARPPEVAREWVDVRKTTPTDTSLWVLGANGYDGSAHILVKIDSTGAVHVSRTERRYGGWYLKGTLGDTASQAICFSKRLGRFGATCDRFVLDTVSGSSVPRITLSGYRGEHSTSDRVLVARGVLSHRGE